MSGSKPPLLAWDTDIFLSLLKKDKSDEQIDGILRVIDAFDRGEVRLCVSTMVIAEVLGYDLHPAKMAAFEEFMENPDLLLWNMDESIAREARDLRVRCKCSGMRLHLQDAVHLATAIHLNADEFHTFDGSSGKRVGLLDIPRIVGDVGVKIVEPDFTELPPPPPPVPRSAPQMSLIPVSRGEDHDEE